MHTLYLGPSWAVQSYESFGGDTDLIKTNLSQELALQNFTRLANYNNTNHQQLTLAERFMQQNPNLGPFRIFLVLCSDLGDAYMQARVDREQYAKIFLTDPDPLKLIIQLQDSVFQRLGSLNVPVAVVGAHTDVFAQLIPQNVTVIHPSWQRFLLEQIGSDHNTNQAWPADVAHMWLRGQLEYDVPLKVNFDPSRQVVFSIARLMSTWATLAQHNLWCGVHPNIQGNRLFANHINTKVNQWIDKTTTIV